MSHLIPSSIEQLTDWLPVGRSWCRLLHVREYKVHTFSFSANGSGLFSLWDTGPPFLPLEEFVSMKNDETMHHRKHFQCFFLFDWHLHEGNNLLKACRSINLTNLTFYLMTLTHWCQSHLYLKCFQTVFPDLTSRMNTNWCVEQMHIWLSFPPRKQQLTATSLSWKLVYSLV